MCCTVDQTTQRITYILCFTYYYGLNTVVWKLRYNLMRREVQGYRVSNDYMVEEELSLSCHAQLDSQYTKYYLNELGLHTYLQLDIMSSHGQSLYVSPIFSPFTTVFMCTCQTQAQSKILEQNHSSESKLFFNHIELLVYIPVHFIYMYSIWLFHKADSSALWVIQIIFWYACAN